MQKIIRYSLFLLLFWLFTLIIANVLLPVFHRSALPVNISNHPFSPEESCSSERILCIDDNEEALLWRLRMIEAAEESITLTTFDFRPDKSGTDIMSALYAAANRGIRVQILIDGIYEPFFLKNNDTIHALDSHENIEIKLYNPIRLKNFYKLNYRMHDKYLVIDNRMFLLGGRNTNDIFLGNYQPNINVDRDILVYETLPGKGCSYLALQEYFEAIWDCSDTVPANYKCSASVLNTQYTYLTDHYQSLCEKYPDLGAFRDWEAVTMETEHISLLNNGIAAQNRAPILLSFIRELALTGSDIQIQTPYIICDSQMYDVLETIEKQAELKLIINAVERGSNPFGCTDYLNNRSKILQTGADVYELLNEHAVHTKTILIDDHLSLVGSYNLDMRSTYLDTELMLVIDSKELNAHLRSMNEQYMQKSLEVCSDGTETFGAHYRPLLLSDSKTMFYSTLRIIIRPFRHLL